MKNYLEKKLQELKNLTDEGYNIPYYEYIKEGGISDKIPALIDEAESVLCKHYGVTGGLKKLFNTSSKVEDFQKEIQIAKEMIPFRNIFSEHFDKILQKHNKEGQLGGYEAGIKEIIRTEKNPENVLSDMIFKKESEKIKSEIAAPGRKQVIIAELNLLKLYHSRLLNKIVNADYSREEYKQIVNEINTTFDDFNKKAYLILHPDYWDEELDKKYFEWAAEAKYSINGYLKKYHSENLIKKDIEHHIEKLMVSNESMLNVVLGKTKVEKPVRIISQVVLIKLLTYSGNFIRFLIDTIDNIKSILAQPNEKPQPAEQTKEQNPESESTVEQDKKIAREHLKILNGKNVLNQKIMTDGDFHRLIEYVFFLIEFEKLPSKIKIISQTNNTSNEFIRYTFYQLHKELYTTKRIKTVWIDFLHKIFKQFKNTDWQTTKTKFSHPPSTYTTDIKQMQKQ